MSERFTNNKTALKYRHFTYNTSALLFKTERGAASCHLLSNDSGILWSSGIITAWPQLNLETSSCKQHGLVVSRMSQQCISSVEQSTTWMLMSQCVSETWGVEWQKSKQAFTERKPMQWCHGEKRGKKKKKHRVTPHQTWFKNLTI